MYWYFYTLQHVLEMRFVTSQGNFKTWYSSILIGKNLKVPFLDYPSKGSLSNGLRDIGGQISA